MLVVDFPTVNWLVLTPRSEQRSMSFCDLGVRLDT